MPQQHSARVGGTVMICTGIASIILIGSMAAFTKAQAPKPPVLLDQGWSAEDRAAYHRSSQGSAVMPYQLFLALEQAEGTEPFRADSVSDRFGLLTEPADPRTNPDGLPIGLVKTSVPAGRWKGDWIGLSCSTCHCSELSYKGQKIRIEGGSNHAFDFAGYISALDQALAATQRDPAKFDRVATRMKANGDGARAELRAQLDEAAEVVHTYISRDAAMATPSGPGRMDALTLIHTRVVDGALGVPENWEAALAPAKPPFLWNAPQSAWVQWSGTASDPFYRNATESMGVFTRMDLRSPSPEQGLFESTVDVRGQLKIEELLRRLAPPKWPEEVFGPIDRAKAARGRALFMEHCSACHSTYPHRWSVPKVDGKRFIENALVPDVYVGTDPQQFKTPGFNRQPEYLTGNMASWMSPPFKGAELAPSLAVLSTARKGVLERALSSAALTPAELVDAHGYRYDWEKPPTQASYKAGPRDGVWATAPFLHNGSVPSLYDLLTPAKERPKTFLIGRDFDPVKVGVDTSGNSGRFEFDTTRIGNSNAGHSFENGPLGAGVIGRLLSEQERWDLVEFLKSIPTEAGQVTPYGGPKDPVEAWSDVHFFNNAQPTSYPVPAPPMELGAERVLPGEGQLIQRFVDQTMARMRIQYPEGSEVRRDAHPKTHGMVKARFEVLDGLPAEFRHGLFATPKSYDAMVRFSASGTEISADTVQQAHGMAIKVLGVEGPKALEDERDATTQDFVMINYPTFLSRNVADYEAFHAARIGGLAQTEVLLKMNPPVLRAIEGLNGAPFWNPLQSRYWSQTPYRLGAGAMKFSARPVVAPVKPAAIQKSPDYLRQAMVTQIGADEVVFEFLVQLQKDPVTMPVEDALVEWMESESPFVRVAMLRIPKQDLSSGEDVRIAENLSFTPWHALEVQRPLGGINRARKVAYEAISKYRHERNGVPRVEP